MAKFNSPEEFEFCEGCKKGKHAIGSFPKNEATRAKELLQVVHTDVHGSTKTQNLRGDRYLLAFIDDKSRCNIAYFMKNKDKVFQKFKDFEAMTTNIT